MNSCNTDRFLATTVVYGLSTLICKIEKKIVLSPASFYHFLSLKIVSDKIENFIYICSFPFFGDLLVRNMVSV